MERKRSIVGNMIDDNSRTGYQIRAERKEETRSRRVNVLVKPSVYDKARKRCDEIGISFNSCINQFLESWVEEEK